MYILNEIAFDVSNKCGGWNKRGAWNILKGNVNVEGGKFPKKE